MILMRCAKTACAARSTGFTTTFVEAGAASKQLPPFHACAGRMGRALNPPPQFGQTLASSSSTQVRQKVHSKEQIIASRELGGKRVAQCSQVGRISSMDLNLRDFA
jgi:hypothetical protein